MANKADIRTEMDLFTAIERGEPVSQLVLSRRLSVSVGLVNALLKRATKKGLAKAKAVPPGRWAYYLTPKGFAEKGQLVAAYLDRSLAFFREAREEYAKLFMDLRKSGIGRVVLVGRGDLAEIAILASQETGVEIVGLWHPQSNSERLYGLRVLRDARELDASVTLVITDSCEPQAAYDTMRTQAAALRIEWPIFLHVTSSVPEDARQ